jgi:hypothetical protein
MTKETNWVIDLHDKVHAAITSLQYVLDEHGEDARTSLEKEMFVHLEGLWDLCRNHPLYSEPTHETHPNLIDVGGEIISYPERVEPLSKSERNEIRTAFDDSMRRAIRNFCKGQKVSKQKFATVYGCTPSYLSNVLAGHKNLDFVLLVATIYKFGYTVKIDPPLSYRLCA